MQSKLSRRTFLEVAGGIAMATSLAGCFGAASTPGSSSGSTVTVWDIRTGNEKTVVQAAADAYNKSQSKIKANVEYFENDPYKQKIQVAIGATPPDIFFGWGGGILKQYVDANEVYDMTADLNADTAWKNKFFPSVMATAVFGGKNYGVPNAGMQTELFFYNKEIFKKYNLTAPTTWAQLTNIIAVLKKNNIIPIGLAGKSQWPYLMWAEFLADRIGGSAPFKAVFAGTAGAWSDPAFIKANTMIQDLVTSGAFGTTYASTSADANDDIALVYKGKAGMVLQGNWNYSTVQTNAPDFLKAGSLGWFPFPAVEGGTGDPSDVYGNPCNFYSIAAKSKSPANAVAYLKNAVLTDDQIKGFIGVGDVPPVAGLDAQLAASPNAEWLTYNYQMAQKAANFQLSWDQILSPAQATAVLTNLSQIFLKQITPQAFSDNMNKTITA
jgi:raffinose/stachyose/melibiose transport system substrate-binding protein